MMRAAGDHNGGAGGLGGRVDVGGVKNRVRGWFLAALERVRGACRGGDLLSGLRHAGGLRVAVLVHIGPAESGQVAVDEHVVGVDDVQGAGAGAQQVRAPDERPPGGLGVIEADDQSEGPRRTGIWDAGDGRVAGPGDTGSARTGGGVTGWVSTRAGRRSAVTRIRPATPASAQAARVQR